MPAWKDIRKFLRTLGNGTNLDERAFGVAKLHELADLLGQHLYQDAAAERGAEDPAVKKLVHLVTASHAADDGNEYTPAGHAARWAHGAAEVITGNPLPHLENLHDLEGRYGDDDEDEPTGKGGSPAPSGAETPPAKTPSPGTTGGGK